MLFIQYHDLHVSRICHSFVAIYQYCVSALRPLSVVNFLSVYEDGVTGVPL